MTGRPLKSPLILGGSSPWTALVSSSSTMNCDAAALSLLVGWATTVTREPTAIPHGSSTATGAPARGAETVAGKDAGADGEGEGDEEEAAAQGERRWAGG